MNLSIQFKDYLNDLKSQANKPVSLALALCPFGINDAPVVTDRDLLVGHLLDALAEEYLEPESVQALDILRVLDDLGSSLVA